MQHACRYYPKRELSCLHCMYYQAIPHATLAAASSALQCNPPGHHAQGKEEACCAGGIYQTSRGMHVPKCRSISDVVASDRRLTSLAETLRRAHFSGTIPPSLQARQPPASC